MKFSKFYFGADYYPEHWPEERWPEDAELMEAAGFNVVRLAEFAWAKIEPQEGRFDFDWLDRSIKILGKHGMQVVLGTPTASPPPWLMARQEDLFIVDRNGIRRTYGLRREYCPNNPCYQQHTERVVSRMVKHYKDNPAVIGWQIDNEFGDRCYCPICQDEFHNWLQNKYHNLDELNKRWGTDFWSHVYTDWTQIPLPLDTGKSANPGLGLDYYRFMSDTYRHYQKLQIDIIRQYTQDQFITHNLMGFGYKYLDYYDNTVDLDFVSWDNYIRTQWNMKSKIDPSAAALSADTMRGLKKKNFWVMEQQSGAVGWEMVAAPPKPGELRLWTYQSIAHGADAILYFRWRTCNTGTEQNWHGILEHHGIPGRRYLETAQVGRELQKIGEILAGSQFKARVAIMQSYDTRFAFQIQPNNPRFGYENHIHDIYNGFFNTNIPVDVISEDDSLFGYKVVIVPALYVLTENTTRNLEKFAASGGLVVFTPRTGVKDDANAVVNMKLPGLIAKMAGVQVEEYISLPEDEDSLVQFCLPGLETVFSVPAWADILRPTTAEVVARFSKDFYAGQAAATLNTFGKGKVIYLGALGDASFYNGITNWILELADIKSLLDSRAGIEVTERWQGDQRLLFVLNHNDNTQEIELGSQYVDLLSGEKFDHSTIIAPWGVLILVTTA